MDDNTVETWYIEHTKTQEVQSMNFLQQRILNEGIVKSGGVLKVDSFLNHQLDLELIDRIGKEFHARFADKPITKVMTIESSGIAIACSVAREFGVPVVVAKKSKSVNIDGEAYTAEVESYTHKRTMQVVVAHKFLSAEDHILLVDDFMANGCAMQGLISIVESAEATVEGLGVVIEKGFQDGGWRLRNLGYRVESLAIIESMNSKTGEIIFRDE